MASTLPMETAITRRQCMVAQTLVPSARRWVAFGKEWAAHGCFCPVDIAVRMCKVQLVACGCLPFTRTNRSVHSSRFGQTVTKTGSGIKFHNRIILTKRFSSQASTNATSHPSSKGVVHPLVIGDSYLVLSEVQTLHFLVA